MQVYDLCSDYYKLSTWTLSYAEIIYPIPSQVDWGILDNEVVIKVIFLDALNKRSKETKQRKSNMVDYDVILGMDWLFKHNATILYEKKKVVFQLMEEYAFELNDIS